MQAGTHGSGRISIILPVRNDHVRALRAITSIRRFAPADAEIVLVDNESDTDDLAREAGPFVDVYKRQHGMLSDCRRAGVAAATGEVLFFMDADQELAEGTLSAGVAWLRQHEAVVIPERPRDETRFLHKVVRSERVWTEWLGLGIPRLFLRSGYERTGGHGQGVLFGEDRFVKPGTISVKVSQIPLYHDEVDGLVDLLVKYRRYGSASSRSSKSFGALVGQGLRRTAEGGRAPSARDVLLVPLVIGLKFMKLAALLLGRVDAMFNRNAHPSHPATGSKST